MRLPSQRLMLRAVIILVAVLIAIQAVPYGRDHRNPPVVREPAWDHPQTRELAKAACFDCHSNETVWPGYASIAPVSWLVQYDVREGREHLNFSDWGRGERKGEKVKELREVMSEGEMPPLVFLLAHPEARMSDSRKQQLLDGLTATFDSSGGGQVGKN